MGTFGFFLNIPKPLDFAAECCKISFIFQGIFLFSSLFFDFQDIEYLYPEKSDQADFFYSREIRYMECRGCFLF